MELPKVYLEGVIDQEGDLRKVWRGLGYLLSVRTYCFTLIVYGAKISSRLA